MQDAYIVFSDILCEEGQNLYISTYWYAENMLKKWGAMATLPPLFLV